MKENYDLKLNADYVLSLFQDAVDFHTKGTPLYVWGDCIMDWYEDQLENDELDWGFVIPNLVYNDLILSKMVVITPNSEIWNEVDQLYKEEGCCCYVGNQTDKIARICYVSKDNDGNTVYLCQEEE